MDINKNAIIFTLLGINALLIGYIYFQEPEVKEVVKTEYKTIMEDKIVYKDELNEEVEEEKKPVETVIEHKNDKKEYVLAKASVLNQRYAISLFSYEQPSKAMDFDKIVLNGLLDDFDVHTKFIMELNKGVLDSINEVYFKVTDSKTKNTYTNNDHCLNNTVVNYIYKTDLQVISEQEISCNIIEEKELDEKSRAPKLGKPVDENVKKHFLKMDGMIGRGL